MRHAFTRATWAYATFLFVVLFAPSLAREPGAGLARPWDALPGPFSWVALCVIEFLAVRQVAAAGAGAGFVRGVTVALVGASAHALGVVVLGPAFYVDAAFARSVALVSWLAVAVAGTLVAALSAVALRGRRPA
jgi:hypothetical protein